MRFIKTEKELQKYIGKVVMFYYTSYDEKVLCAWAKKITRIEKGIKLRPSVSIGKNLLEKDVEIKKLNVYGVNTVFFDPKGMEYPKLSSLNETPSNAQEIARELTATELIMYRKAVIKKRES